MFIENTTINVNWIIPAMVAPIPLTDFDIRIRDPECDVTIIPSAILAEDYILPTDTKAGGVTYPFVPTSKGVWLVVLTTKDGAAQHLYYEYYLEVHINDTHIYQQVRL